ncbi:MAG TPA: hypothetical protein DEH78_04985 [Solibacterales bacterium]|nr:hypothetical protein [Bryobacterales bacterium]
MVACRKCRKRIELTGQSVVLVGDNVPRPGDADFDPAAQLYVDSAECIDCGACVPVCPTNSIFTLDELPGELTPFVAVNEAYYGRN